MELLKEPLGSTCSAAALIEIRSHAARDIEILGILVFLCALHNAIRHGRNAARGIDIINSLVWAGCRGSRGKSTGEDDAEGDNACKVVESYHLLQW